MYLYGSVVKMDLYDFVWSFMADSNFGARLRDFRMKKRLSLQGLADAIGASKAHVWDLEQGKTKNPSLALLTSLSRALGVSIKDLVGETSETSANEPAQLAPLFRDLRGLNPDQLELIRAMTEKLREMGDGNKSGGGSK
jgi:transcriptional regulator with XRE-family HTH domain